MKFFSTCMRFLVITGTLLYSLIALISCQSTPQVQATPTPNILSTAVSEQLTKVVLLVTLTPDETNTDKFAETVTPTFTNDELSQPDVATANGIEIRLEHVEENENGYLLKGKTSKIPGLWLMVLLGEGTQLLDAQGSVIPTTYHSTGGTIQNTFEDWGLQTIGKDFPGPWKLNIPSLFIELSHKVSFTIDLGFTPQIGHSWDLNMPVDYAGYTFFIQKAELFQSSEKDRPCLKFLFTSGPDIFRIGGVTDPANRSRHTDMQVSDAINGSSFNSLCYDQAPAGIHSFDIYTIDVIQQGPWTLRWQPPIK